MSAVEPALDELGIAAEPSAWRDTGFRVEGEDRAPVVHVGTVAIGLAGAAAGRIAAPGILRLGETILEVAQAPPGSPLQPDSPARFYGLAFVVEDLDATAAALGDLCGEPRDAVQPGRRIATVRKEAGLGLPVAFVTPPPK